MLKIKDTVDLKELENFGFQLSDDKQYYECLINGNWWDIRAIDIEDRCLVEFEEEVGYWTYTDDDELLAIIFDDLIKADLVEKVEDK